MEADSQISCSKTLENKSLLSFNYIYKKIIIKESFNNSKKELRQLNYEKIAKYKMKNLNIKYFLEFIIKLKNTLNENNPFLKYIKDVQPYDYINIKINISQTEPLLNQYNINKKIIKNSIKKEKILNFSDIKKNMKNFYFSRMYNIEYKKVNHELSELHDEFENAPKKYKEKFQRFEALQVMNNLYENSFIYQYFKNKMNK